MAKYRLQGSGKRLNYEEIDTIVGSDVTLIGDIVSGGNVRYEGILKGNVSLEGNLVVGRNALITGDIKAKNVHIIGAVEGNVTCEQLKILATGKLTGDTYVDNIIIDEGAVFIGGCKVKEKQAEETVTEENSIEENKGE